MNAAIQVSKEIGIARDGNSVFNDQIVAIGAITIKTITSAINNKILKKESLILILM
jgi:hypothetical protein